MAIDTSGFEALLGKLEAARTALARMPVQAPSAQGAAAQTGAARAVDFAQLLKDSVAKVNDTQTSATSLAERFQLGDPKVSLEETMVALSKANISLQQMVQVRNRVIAAYHDIMNLQV